MTRRDFQQEIDDEREASCARIAMSPWYILAGMFIAIIFWAVSAHAAGACGTDNSNPPRGVLRKLRTGYAMIDIIELNAAAEVRHDLHSNPDPV